MQYKSAAQHTFFSKNRTKELTAAKEERGVGGIVDIQRVKQAKTRCILVAKSVVVDDVVARVGIVGGVGQSKEQLRQASLRVGVILKNMCKCRVPQRFRQTLPQRLSSPTIQILIDEG